MSQTTKVDLTTAAHKYLDYGFQSLTAAERAMVSRDPASLSRIAVQLTMLAMQSTS